MTQDKRKVRSKRNICLKKLPCISTTLNVRLYFLYFLENRNVVVKTLKILRYFFSLNPRLSRRFGIKSDSI